MPPDPLAILHNINLLKQPLHILIVWPDYLKIASYAPGITLHRHGVINNSATWLPVEEDAYAYGHRAGLLKNNYMTI